MTRMSLRAGRPLNWNVLTIDVSEPARFENQLRAQEDAAKQGAQIVALTMPTVVGLTMSFLTYSAIHQLPGWLPILSLPVVRRMAELRKPEIRAELLKGARSPEAGVFARVADWGNFRIGETYSKANEGLTGRLVRGYCAGARAGAFRRPRRSGSGRRTTDRSLATAAGGGTAEVGVSGFVRGRIRM